MHSKFIKPLVIRRGGSPVVTTPGGGILTSIIHRDTVNSVSCSFGIGEVDHGKSLHRWHNHVYDGSPQMKITYPEGFEEFYYIFKGNATVQWKLEDGEICEETVGEGDTVFFPVSVVEHQVLNTGDTKMIIFVGGSPPTIREVLNEQ